MSSCCQSSTLYKGLLTFVLLLITFEYLFYGANIIEVRNWENRFPLNATRNPHTIDNRMRHPLFKWTVPNARPFTEKNLMVTRALVPHATLYSSNSPNGTESAIETREGMNASALRCPLIPPDLQGEIPVIKSPVPSINELEKRFSWLKPGGHWFPTFCKPSKKVAIIIPFRCRGQHLLVFLRHMHPFLRKQQLDYTIFLVEQDGDAPFNRAMLMNAGFKEAVAIGHFDCFIFHDIDLLPENDRNLYTCPEQPRHMSVAIDVFNYKLPYPGIFGGVCAITRQHFQLLNGFSNSFWGWGGEDDDMSNRIRYHRLHISRYPMNIARYKMMHHQKDKPNSNRYDLLKAGQKKHDTDGLNSLKYNVKETKHVLLYTWLLVELDPPS